MIRISYDSPKTACIIYYLQHHNSFVLNLISHNTNFELIWKTNVDINKELHFVLFLIETNCTDLHIRLIPRANCCWFESLISKPEDFGDICVDKCTIKMH